jgi:hypothetical protein
LGRIGGEVLSSGLAGRTTTSSPRLANSTTASPPPPLLFSRIYRFSLLLFSLYLSNADLHEAEIIVVATCLI